MVHPHNGIVFIKRNEGLIPAITQSTFETVYYVKETRHKRSNTIQFHLVEMFRMVKLMGQKGLWPAGAGKRIANDH